MTAMDDLAWAYMNPYNTGLPMAIWIGQHGYRRPPRGIRQTIRVNRQHGSIADYIDIEEAETAEIDVETGEVTDSNPVLCSSRHHEQLARYHWDNDHNRIFSRGYGLWPNRMWLPL